MPTYEGITFLDKPTRVDAGTHNGARNKPNEDRFGVFTGPGDSGRPALFLVVADGVTSTHGGERASDIAVRVLQQNLQAPTQTNGRSGAKSLRDRLADAIHRANQEILETARKDPELKGMSTTLVVAAVDGDQLMVMHVGDSRAYLIRNGKAHQLTRDHTWVQEALEEGRITREQAANHPNRHVILRYLGDARGISIDQGILDPDKPAVDIDETEVGRQQSRANDTTLTLRAGDALLLCSDGLYGRITDGEMAAAVTKFAPEKAVKSMIDEAVKRDEPDNITIVLWPTASAATPVAAVATASKRPALLLAVAGVLLVLLAAFIFMRPGAEPAPVAAPTADASLVAAAPTGAVTEVPVESPAAAPPTATAAVTATPTETPETTPVPTETPDINPSADNADGNLADIEQTSQISNTASLTETISNSLTAGIVGVVSTLEGVPSPTATAVSVTKTPPPTSTPMATPTPRATSTPTPTPTQVRAATATGQAVTGNPASSQASSDDNGPKGVTNLKPPNGEASSNPVTFSWDPDRQLVGNQLFEVQFWNSGETETDGKSWVAASTATSVRIDPAERSGTYQWAVFLVSADPYRTLRRISEIRTFTVSGRTTDDDGPKCNTGEEGCR